MVIDVAATFVAFLVAAWVTQVIDFVIYSPGALGHVLFLATVNVIVYAAAKMYSCLWEYASLDESMRLVAASLIGTLVGDIVGLALFGSRFPLRVYCVEWPIFLGITASARFAIRVYSGRKSWSIFGVSSAGMPRTLIVGAGDTGSLVVKRMLACDSAVSGCPVGLVDDDPGKIGSYVHGIRVVGGCSQIPKLALALKVEQLVFAMPSATKAERDRVLGFCMETGLKVLAMPNIKGVSLDDAWQISLREVDVSDLLSREEIHLDAGRMSYVAGKCVLVTGGGGSIGSELVRQLMETLPDKIVIFDIYENTAYELYHELLPTARDKGIELCVEIGSITHLPALEKCFEDHRPEVVFHAAAHKHVPLMEANAREAVENNVFGTKNVIELAHQKGCSHFILISTDKAVNPTNVMGATKRMCEMLVQHYASFSDTIFAAVRFGNVLGSHGSVVPLFKRQLRAGGPVTVTDKRITRYFMTIPEASRLVLTAGALSHGGEIFILDMGEPVSIWMLAENLIKLSGLEPGKDIQIIETGLRPGEKLYEELLMDEDEPLPTDFDGIMVSRAIAPNDESLNARVQNLAESLSLSNSEIKMALRCAVPSYTPQIES
ncbi:polysaccharide biosynthesis protein [Adlercreutzia shanghongiae]|uniref:Nucleoside-diphosphate sugar epimerase/dehydratase n=1 Tax=Adlercreutzia shanghongiae TaxID=3111773 RepID=A0ABU6J0C8_9ACTN|nr:nucleoside-diphosphate sugar epimerase/dehydratase [Adlercreutzia sp. R22]MEC4295545.1 nucleoside-diphosphate sugar epimerase/dehydratase [Adlercreutzia sp. R22]